VIRRVLALGPLAFLTSGCASEASTPAVNVSSPWDHEVHIQSPDVPPTAQVLGAWQLPPGDPWSRYAKYTLLSALDAYGPIDELPDASEIPIVPKAQRAAVRVADQGLPDGTMWIVDLQGAGSVAFGSTLARASAQRVSLIPTFNNWPADDELVPADDTLAVMVQFPPPAASDPAGAPTTPVFLLDAWRLAFRGDDPGDEVVDNRYILTPSDLPDVATLRARGIHDVVYVVEKLDGANVEEDDLHATFEAYQAEGITLTIVDLDVLTGVAPGVRWHEFLAPYVYVCYPRFTLIQDPAFYGRARGGFGGIHSFPGGRGPVVVHAGESGGAAAVGGHGVGGHGGFGGHGGG